MELIDPSDSYMNKIILSLARIFLGKAKTRPWCYDGVYYPAPKASGEKYDKGSSPV